MSYAISIKNELSALMPDKRCCALSEIAGMLNTSGDLEDGCLSFKTENWAVARKYFTLIKKTFNISVENRFVKKAKNSKNSRYELAINDPEQVGKVLSATGKTGQTTYNRHISGIVVKSECCKRSYLRGTFLAGGSVASPEKEYHLELSLKSSTNAEETIKLLSYFEISAKLLERHRGFSVYVKDSAQIADFLNVAGAKNALFSYENVKALKEVRNGVNRLVNCDTANIKKTVAASQKQINAIKLIDEAVGLSSLNKTLRQTAVARMENPEMKLEELGSLLGIGKSGVNHRLRKIELIAAELEI